MNNQPGCRDRGRAAGSRSGFLPGRLRHIDASRAQRRHSGCATPLHGAAVGQHLARGRRFRREGCLPYLEPVAPLACGPKINVHKPGARIEAEAEEPDLPRRKLEDNGIVVRHGDIEGGSVKMLRPGRASHGAVVREAAIGRANDQRLAKPVAQRLQLVERGLVDQQLSGALAVSVEDTPLLRRAFACEISVQFQKVTGRLSKPTGAREPNC